MKHQPLLLRTGSAAAVLGGLIVVALAHPAAQPAPATAWWAPGQGTPLPEYATYDNDRGHAGILNVSGPVTTAGHPFFEPIGTNGRACITCHQPADGMALSLRSIRERWEATRGADPLFAPVDGMNCPDLPRGEAQSHSLLLERGLIRIALPWPPRRPDGTPIDPEFTIEVVRDPSGCNLDPVYGLQSRDPAVSVFRRPRPAANTKYTTHQNFGVGPFVGKNGMPTATDPATGRPTSMNLLADARLPTLAMQAEDAARNHLQLAGPLGASQVARIVEFESQVYAAQVASRAAGTLVGPDGPPAFGPRNLAAGEAGVLGNNTTRYVFPMAGRWRNLPRTGNEAEDARSAARESIARGHDVFMFRTFWIRDSMHLNTVGLGNPAKRTCATCHGMHMTGMDTAYGWMDIGTTNLPWASEVPLNPWTEARPQMPLFRITCKPGVRPHPFLGRVIYTQDPGRALVSGQCNDVGTIVMQQFRGLAARAPYFSNGSAATLRELVDFYDRRYGIGFSERERQDLVNFLGAL
jgi:hypothetical protein